MLRGASISAFAQEYIFLLFKIFNTIVIMSVPTPDFFKTFKPKIFLLTIMIICEKFHSFIMKPFIVLIMNFYRILNKTLVQPVI